jgi:hypothetical protein
MVFSGNFPEDEIGFLINAQGISVTSLEDYGCFSFYPGYPFSRHGTCATSFCELQQNPD